MRSTHQFVNDLSQIGEAFFKDFFSEKTVKRQNFLIGLSIASLLIYYSIVSQDGGSILGMRFDTEREDQINFLFSLAISYVLLIYWLSARRDWVSYKYKQLAALSKISELTDENLAYRKHQEEEINKLFSESKDILSARKYFFDERKKISEEYRERVEDIRRDMDAMSAKEQLSEVSRLFQEMERLRRETDKSLTPYDELIEDIKSDKSIDEIFSKIEELSDQKDDLTRNKAIKSVFDRYKMMLRLEFSVEITMPSLLAMYAVAVGL